MKPKVGCSRDGSRFTSGLHPRVRSHTEQGSRGLLPQMLIPECLVLSSQACLLLTEYEQARDFLVRAQKEQPCNHDINNELKKLSR